MVNEAGQLAAGVPIALGAAAAFGGSSVLQFRAGRQVPEEPAGRPTLLLRLTRISGWRWSVVLALTAFSLQVAALSLIPLILVQPLLVTGLIWYILLFAAAKRDRPDRSMLMESSLCLLGLAAFLGIAEPTRGAGGGRLDALGPAVLLGVAVVAAVGLCLLAAMRLGRRWRPLPLALACGVCYGVTASLISSLSFHQAETALGVLEHWQTYGIMLLGPFGVLLSQNAYQAGPMGAPALAAITVTDPVLAIVVGLLWLDEGIQTGPWRIIGQVFSLALVVAAVFLLARRAPHVKGA
jgi:drug/metabolite transporter (DMT)-like permease